ncbi:MFS transporter [Nocardia mangyaensis]|uniref:MFS transporter n=1 Tax=Nocardia mangyaensis TaxID=2213200 RepID=UPI002676823E|nr:MFS transporter [Nocardia mangyaensis]MDO3647554.1 MFS transporter [Nocardia mangyaensis]
MTREPVGVRGVAVRAVLFKGTRDLLPIYALYGVLFAENGLSTAQISLLLAIWSVTSFVLEVPSGAWADTVSRRGLLILSCVLQAACFAGWMLVPTFAGFALGFLLWGIAGALESGTFEALIYDDLVARGEPSAYASIMGWARGAQEGTVLVAILAAAPLFAWGGFPLVGWVSVGIGVLHTLTAFALPAAPKSISATAVDDLDDEPNPGALGPHIIPGAPSGTTDPHGSTSAEQQSARSADEQPGSDEADSAGDTSGPVDRGTSGDPRRSGGESEVHESGAAEPASAAPSSRYLTMLRTGLGEALRVRRVRRGVLLGALLYGITAFDEYFGLLAVSGGASTSTSALLVGVTVVGSLVGSLLAGRAEVLSARTLSIALFVAAILFIAGALAAGVGAGPALLWIGFLGIGIAYGIDFTVEVVAGARLQEAIEGPARATVTSVSGLLSEVVALAVFGFVAAATVWLSMSVTIAALGLVLLATAAVIPTWLPPRRDEAA